jgi:hypothetical protein
VGVTWYELDWNIRGILIIGSIVPSFFLWGLLQEGQIAKKQREALWEKLDKIEKLLAIRHSE